MAEWWRGATVYQVYPRSFLDTTGNGIGDLPGITQKLDHIASLGVDAVWISPIFPSPMADMGYDVSNYIDIEPLFGTLADFDTLMEKAHRLGLKIVLDQVLNHTASVHPWFVESRASRDNPKADWYVWADPKPDGTPPNNWQSNFGGAAWEWEPRRQQYYLHNFLASQPDLNFHNPQVQDALLDVMRFWLDRGVDGFRLDTVIFYFHDAQLRDDPPNPTQVGKHWGIPYHAQDHLYSKTQPENIPFLQRLRTLTDTYDDRMMVGEIGDEGRSIQTMAAYTRGNDRLHMSYSFEMLGPDYSAAHFRAKIEEFFNGAPDGWPCWSFSNHDVMRHVTRWLHHGISQDALAKQAAALILSMEGSIGLYQGEEVGQTETVMAFEELTDPPGIRMWPDYKGRDGCRTPMVWNDIAQGGFTSGTPWLPVKGPQLARNVAAQEAANDSVLHAYREMLAWRKKSPALLTGRTHFYDLDEPVLAFARRQNGRDLICIFNLSPVPISLMVTGNCSPVGPSFADKPDAGGQLYLRENGCAFLDSAAESITLKRI